MHSDHTFDIQTIKGGDGETDALHFPSVTPSPPSSGLSIDRCISQREKRSWEEGGGLLIFRDPGTVRVERSKPSKNWQFLWVFKDRCYFLLRNVGLSGFPPYCIHVCFFLIIHNFKRYLMKHWFTQGTQFASFCKGVLCIIGQLL